MTTSSAGDAPILLAFSGGLDTSFCVPWLKDTYRRPVITVTVDTGGIDAEAAQSLARRSAELGARTVDLTSRPERKAANGLYLRMGFEVRQTNVYRRALEAPG